MNYADFERFAHDVYRRIPPEYREGVEGLEVSRKAVPHPTLPDIYTLGECLSEYYPSEFGGAGEVRSVVALYYGSFLALSRLDEAFDWEGEIEETVYHEVRHHLESLATEDALEEMDYAEDQNFLRREGRDFDPFFFRFGERVEEGAYEVDGDLFLEREVRAAAIAAREPVPVTLRGREHRVPLPDPLGDVHYLRLEGVEEDPRGDVVLVLVRRRGVGEWVRDLFRRARLEVLHSEWAPGGG